MKRAESPIFTRVHAVFSKRRERPFPASNPVRVAHLRKPNNQAPNPLKRLPRLRRFDPRHGDVEDRHVAIFGGEVGDVIDAAGEDAGAGGIDLLPAFGFAIGFGPDVGVGT